MIEIDNCCVCCGEIIPECMQCCQSCIDGNIKLEIYTPERKHILWDLIFGKGEKKETMQITVSEANMKIENGKLIIDITSDIEKVLNAGKVQVGTLNAGDVFKIGDEEFIFLERTDKGVAIIRKDFLFTSTFGNDNNWNISHIRSRLNGEYLNALAAKVGAENIIPFERDLTSWDGLDDYGVCIDKISLLTTAEYAKYHKILGLNSKYPDWQFLITPYSTPSNGYTRDVCVVLGDGALFWYVCGFANGARPFLILNPSVLVSRV